MKAIEARTLCNVFATLLAVIGLAAPAAAGEFALHLETTPAVQSLDLELAGTFAGGTIGGPQQDSLLAAAVPAEQPRFLDLRFDPTQGLRQSVGDPVTQAQQDPPQGNRTWRWLKRHWYVPVLVGGAIALAVQGDDSSDSDGED